jgi:hypothetical protein
MCATSVTAVTDLPRLQLPNVVVKWLTLLLRIRDFSGSNLGPETGFPDWDFRGFPQSLQANAGIVT